MYTLSHKTDYVIMNEKIKSRISLGSRRCSGKISNNHIIGSNAKIRSNTCKIDI